MKVSLIAADSLGTRSMATFIELSNINLFIDPSVALGPRRYGLPPHEIELKRFEEHWNEIAEKLEESDVVVITHYHYDHHNPAYAELFENKHVIVKHPAEKINRSQKERARFFLGEIKNYAKKIEIADGNEFNFGKAKIIFSPPVFHGTNNKLGYVVEVFVKEKGESFLFSSDVEGPSIKEQVGFILKHHAEIVYIDGPMSYMLGYRYAQKSLEASVKNMIRILKETEVQALIVDHHFLRDLKWHERISDAFEFAEKKKKSIKTAAEFMGLKNELLEARRKELYAAS